MDSSSLLCKYRRKKGDVDICTVTNTQCNDCGKKEKDRAHMIKGGTNYGRKENI